MLKTFSQWIGQKFRKKKEAPFQFGPIEEKIKYSFKNKRLLQQALKHRSYLNYSREKAYESNERMEFLGDAVLELIVTEHLYCTFKTENEGELSQKKSVLVSRRALGKIIEEMKLGQYLLIDRGEEKTGGRERSSNLANLFEAILGAIYLDGGYEPSKKFVQQFLLSREEEILKIKTFYNYKSELLEFSQSKGWGMPHYHVESESGPDHDKRFIISVNVAKKWSAKGTGKSKKRAEQKAARNVLIKIKEAESEI